MPGKRSGGFVASMSRNSFSGSRWRLRAASTRARPRRQVSMTTVRTSASSSGYQPPSCSFGRFAAKKVRSISRKKPLTATTRSGLKPHFNAISAASPVVIAISNETAMP